MIRVTALAAVLALTLSATSPAAADVQHWPRPAPPPAPVNQGVDWQAMAREGPAVRLPGNVLDTIEKLGELPDRLERAVFWIGVSAAGIGAAFALLTGALIMPLIKAACRD